MAERENKSKIPKVSRLVLSAIQGLKDERGSTPKEIVNFISSEYPVKINNIQRKVATALKRGVDYGILRQVRTRYRMDDVELDGRRRRRKTTNRRRRKSRTGRSRSRRTKS